MIHTYILWFLPIYLLCCSKLANSTNPHSIDPCSRYKQDVYQLQAEILQYHRENLSLKAENTDLKKIIKDLEKTQVIQKIENQIEELMHKTNSLEKLPTKLSQVENQVTELESKLKLNQKTSAVQLQNIENQVQINKKDLNEISNSIKTGLNNKISDLDSKLADLKNSTTAKIDTQFNEHQVVGNKVNDLALQVSNLDRSVSVASQNNLAMKKFPVKLGLG